MKKNQFYLYLLLPLSLLILNGCQDSSQGEDETIRRLEANSKLLEVNGKVATFPLTIVIADQLNGETFPQEIQNLCALSTDACKTLPIAGILRLGPNNYYTYNCIADLKLPTAIEKNEGAITETTNEQVNAYLSTAKLTNYDSLLSPNHEEWNLRELSQTYINNTADSIFFYSQIPLGQSGIQVGAKRYKVYTDIAELRKRINELICTSHPTISVFYNFLSFPTAGATTPGSATPESTSPGSTNSPPVVTPAPTFPAKGLAAGDTCVGQSKYEKLHNGQGGFILGTLKEANSTACGFVFPTGRAGDTCVSGSKFQKMHDGRGGFRVGTLLERNSTACGYTPPVVKTPPVKAPVVKTPDPKPPVASPPVSTSPAKGTPASGFTCYNGSKYAKVHNGRGGFSRGELVEQNSSDCIVKAPVDNQCVRRSEPTCEQDAGGNYTGRRIQNCFNRSGKVVKVIVLSKCDSDCRCIGG